jgi:rhomboid protease GluP
MLVILSLCGTLYSGVQIANGYDQYMLSRFLIPPDGLPKEDALAKQESARLVAAYPRDPRSHMYRALALQEAGNGKAAENEWKAALAEDKILRLFFKPELEHIIRGNFALILKENGKEQEANTVAKPSCGTGGRIGQILAEEGLCGALRPEG